MSFLRNAVFASLLLQLARCCAPLTPNPDGGVDGSKLGKEARISLLVSPPTPWSYNKDGMFTTAQAPSAMKAQDNMMRDINKAIKIILIESSYATDWVSQVSPDPNFIPIEGWVGNSCSEGEENGGTATPGVPGTTTDGPGVTDGNGATDAPAATEGTDAPAATEGTDAPAATEGTDAPAVTEGTDAPDAVTVETITDAPITQADPVEELLQIAPRRGKRSADHGHPKFQDYDGMISKTCNADGRVSGDFEYAVDLKVTTKMPITENSWNDMAVKLQDKLSSKGISFYQDIKVAVTYI